MQAELDVAARDLKRAQADRAQFDLEVVQGVHVPRDMVAAATATAFSAFAQALRSVGPTLERTAGLTPEQAGLVEGSVDAALAALADSLKKMTEMPGAAAR